VKQRSTLIGLLVLGLVVAGVYWARLRPPSPSAGLLQPTAMAGQASSDDALPDVSKADAAVDLGDVRIVVSLSPHPPVAFAKFQLRVTSSGPAPAEASAAGAGTEWPLAIKGGQVAFEMKMPMGDHRYSLVPAGRGGYVADVVLPLCASGSRRWYATIAGDVAGQPRSVRVRFDLAPPPQAPSP